jgi:hypothetical protein
MFYWLQFLFFLVFCIIISINGDDGVVQNVEDTVEKQIDASDRTKENELLGIGTATIAALLTKARIDSEIENIKHVKDDDNYQQPNSKNEDESGVGHNSQANASPVLKSDHVAISETGVPIRDPLIMNNSSNNHDMKHVWGSSDQELSDSKEDVELSQNDNVSFVVHEIHDENAMNTEPDVNPEGNTQKQDLTKVWGSDVTDDRLESTSSPTDSPSNGDKTILEMKRAWGTPDSNVGTIETDTLNSKKANNEPIENYTAISEDVIPNSQQSKKDKVYEPQHDYDEAKRMRGSNSEKHHHLDHTTGSLPKFNFSKEFGTGSVHSQINSSTTAITGAETNQHKEQSDAKSSTVPHLPFFSPINTHKGVRHDPPEGFAFTARVYLSPVDALAHFDYVENDQFDANDQINIDEQPKPSLKRLLQELSLPYWDCGVVGSTTSPLRVKEAYFRSAMGSSTSWNNVDNAVHPVIAIALTPCRLELNSEEAIDVMAGDVVLLEDSLRPGHRFVPLSMQKSKSKSHEAQVSPELKLLFLTLPQHHHHAGKKYISVKDIMQATRTHPCPMSFDDAGKASSAGEFLKDSESIKSNTRKTLDIDVLGHNIKNIIPSAINTLRKENFWDERKLRLLALGTLGMSLSTLAADFIGRTAPLWLAVGIGGTFFIGFGTYGFTVVADNLLSDAQLWQERRRLNLHQQVPQMNKTAPNDS